MYCLGCGTDLTNQQANRRVVSSHSDIVDLWKTVVSEWDEQYTSAEDIMQEQPYMCRGCFSAYSRFIVDLWKTVVSEWDEQYTSAEDIVQEQPYMCRGCFSAYSRFIAMKTKITTNIAETMRCFSIQCKKLKHMTVFRKTNRLVRNL